MTTAISAPPQVPAVLLHLLNCAADYDTAQAFVEAVHAGKCIAKGEWVKVPSVALVGYVVGQGFIGSKRWPAWQIATDQAGKRTEIIPKEDVIHVTGCHDSYLVNLWNLKHES